MLQRGDVFLLRYNRTYVELKPSKQSETINGLQGYNRTYVELKLMSHDLHKYDGFLL